MKEIEENRKKWEKTTLSRVLEKFGERKKDFHTESGLPIQRLYTPSPDFDYLEKLGFPGQYPFTRGVQPTMYRGRFWTMRQYAGFATAQESNRRYRYLLDSGTTGLSVAFDLPTQIGYDSDDPIAEGEVGKVGVAIDSLQDMETLFDQIPLDKVSTSMTINSTASILLAMYIAVAKKQGVAMESLSGTIQNDILKEYIARGTYIFPPEPSMRIITDIFQFCNQELPRWNTISISGYHIREAGATAVQEVAFTFADAIAYVQAAMGVGLDVDSFAGRLSFFFNAHNNLFEEIAKFRAARRLWAKIMRHKFGAKNPKSMMLRFHTQTAGSTLTAKQPDNNIIRTTVQALSAVLGGTQSLHTNSRDEALSLPTEDSARVAIRTQQILAYESGVTDTVDPLAGSYFVEYLTDQIEKKVTEYLEKIEAMGGAVEAVKSKYFQNEIAQSAYRYQQKVEQGEEVVVGVNKFTVVEKDTPPILEIDERQVRNQILRLKKLRAQRNRQRVQESLQHLESAARGSENLMPRIIDCVEQYATVGEIANTLRGVFVIFHTRGMQEFIFGERNDRWL
ncbi:methylmalonyl-CoA mutase [candidate division KSB1 bacterium 4484_188]|nr:MAG: methylmalonyl-CoA mutase [candidate division KSB1 bacterium 4484_188]